MQQLVLTFSASQGVTFNPRTGRLSSGFALFDGRLRPVFTQSLAFEDAHLQVCIFDPRLFVADRPSNRILGWTIAQEDFTAKTLEDEEFQIRRGEIYHLLWQLDAKVPASTYSRGHSLTVFPDAVDISPAAVGASHVTPCMQYSQPGKGKPVFFLDAVRLRVNAIGKPEPVSRVFHLDMRYAGQQWGWG